MYMHIEYDYPLGLIANMNEIPVTFDLPSTQQLMKQEHSRLVSEQPDMKKPTLQLF